MHPTRETSLDEPLVLALSRIHRSRSMDQLREVFLRDIPRLIEADAYGMYLFDEDLKTRSVFAYQAQSRFLSEYEEQRDSDPLLRHVLKRQRFTHSLEMFSETEWTQQALFSFLSRWGLAFSIEAPLIANGTVVGTINFATSNLNYFSNRTLAMARFLCRELETACGRLVEVDLLNKELIRSRGRKQFTPSLPRRTTQVMERLASGMNNRAIASELRISENTVRYHIKRIYRELGVRNRAQLVKRLYN